MPQDPFDKLFDQPYLICDEQDQGQKIKALCVLTGVEVREDFVVGPIKIRPRDAENDHFPEGTRFDFSYSVLELNYIDRTTALSMYVEPMWVQEAAFKAIQLLVNSWSGISLIYHFDENNKQVAHPVPLVFKLLTLNPPKYWKLQIRIKNSLKQFFGQVEVISSTQ